MKDSPQWAGRKHTPYRWIQLLLVLGAASIAIAALFLRGTLGYTAHAEGSGRVCVFFAPTGAPVLDRNLGHVGWAFRVGQEDNWVYGATEGGDVQPPIPAGTYKGSWMRQGTWLSYWPSSPSVVTDFAGDLPNEGDAVHPYYHTSGYYTQVRCKDTDSSAVNSASQMAQSIAKQEYSIPLHDCLSDVMNILQAYDSDLGFSVLTEPFAPFGWFTHSLNDAGFEDASNLSDQVPQYWGT